MPFIANPPIIDKEAGLRVKEVRKFLDMGQTEFAELGGISQPMVARIEKGEREIPFVLVQNLWVKKGINPNFIFIGYPEPLEYKFR